ncbi:protein of unknown function (DUF3328) domain containing protein [Amanita muscaria]
MQRTVIALVVLSTASLYLTYTLIDVAKTVKAVLDTRRVLHTTKPLESYSFLGHDRPRYLPAEYQRARMAVEESVHYPIVGPAAKEEWLWTAALGDNHVRLGPEKRMFAVAMFHQLHCLRGIRESLEVGWEALSLPRRGHIHHCFNYIRQWTLCDGDLTLEPGDFTKRNFTVERQGAVHTCRDWELVYDYMAERWKDWTKFRIEHDIPYIDAD